MWRPCVSISCCIRQAKLLKAVANRFFTIFGYARNIFYAVCCTFREPFR
uniref:Uncharacterized protein n=1 Tax=Lepeophtheirus salmonis TaxID=72036 RepID=A0A0K2TYR2_LEPSM